jgi:hypothetical protein
MKSTISKILGVAVTLTILASLLVTGTALPASAAVGTMAYGSLPTPGASGKVLISAAEVDFLVASPDGKTLFAWDNTADVLYKSVNTGATWATRATGSVGLPTAITVVGMAVSPAFATDNTVVVVEGAKVWVSIDGGINFNEVQTADLLVKMESGAITSVDMGAYYATGRVNILIGIAASAGTYSNVLRFDTGTPYGVWTETGAIKDSSFTATATATVAGNVVTAITMVLNGSGYTAVPAVTITDNGTTHDTYTATATVVAGSVTAIAFTAAGTGVAVTAATVAVAAPTATNFNVYAVKFSPSHTTDAEIMAIISNGTDAKLYSSFAGATFGNPITLAATGATTSAVIATGTDYQGFAAGNTVAIGLNGGAADVWRVTGRSSATAGTASDRNVLGTGNANVKSIAINGPIATATVLVGLVGSPIVYRNATFAGTTTTFTAASKSPTGVAGNCVVLWSGTSAIAGTTGVDSAISVSTDGAINFNAISLIDVGTLGNVTLRDIEVADANNIFITMANPAGGNYPSRSVFRTTDGGATWTRILVNNAAGPLFEIGCVSISPAYASDKTVFVSQGTAGAATIMVFKSIDNGNSFTPMVSSENSSILRAVDGTNYYYSGATGTTFYKYGRFTTGTFPTGTTSPVFSMAFNPKDATKATIAVGLNNGRVYQSTNDGVSFTGIGTTTPQGTNADAVYVAYGPDGSLYAMGSGASGIYRWTGTAWLSLAAGITNGTGLVVTPDGTLYASTANVGAGIYRSLNPTLGDITDVTPCEFQQLSNANFPDTYAGTYALADLAVAATATVNTLYAVETATAVDSPAVFGYLGRVYGFKDTFIVAPTLSSPADKAVLTTTVYAKLAWTAFTGATLCEVAVNLDKTFPVGTNEGIDTKTTTAATTDDDLDQGTTYYWRVRATSVEIHASPTKLIYSRWATVRSFVTALVRPAVDTIQLPKQGATDVAVDTTFTWPVSAAAGTVTYEFVIAEELGNADKFAIIDDSATTTTNAHKLRESLKYDTQYWWRVRAVSASSTSAWTTSFFTTAKEPVVAPTTTAAVTTIIVPTQPAVTPIITVIPPETKEVIPTYLLWAVIAVGAILVIAVIVLIVRTRRIS